MSSDDPTDPAPTRRADAPASAAPHPATAHPADPTAAASETPDPPVSPPLLAEDVMLALFQPDSGTIAGENTLFYVLAGALLTDLAQAKAVRTDEQGLRGVVVTTVGEPPHDELLRAEWSYVAEKPRSVHTVLAAVGPTLREPVLDRLVARGDIRRRTRKALGFIPSTSLEEGSPRRSELITQMRAVLVDGVEPDSRLAALIGLVSASGALSTLHREIPWTSSVITRAKSLERGEWGSRAAAAAVTRTMTAVITNAIVAATVLPRN